MARRIFTSIVLSFFLLNSLFAAEKPVVKIGVILPLTGNVAHVGTSYHDAVLLALSEVPATSKFKYEAVFEDDQLQSQKVAMGATKLLTVDKVKAIVAMWSYGGDVVAPMAEKNKIVSFAYAWDPVAARGEYNFLNATPPKTLIPHFLEGFKRKNWKKITTITVQEAGALHAIKEMNRLAPAAGFEIVENFTVNYGDRDFRTLLAKVKAKPSDVLFLCLGTPELELFLNQMRQAGINTPFTAIGGFETITDISLIEGRWYIPAAYEPQSFVDKYQARYHHTAIPGSGNFYDIIRLLVHSFEAIGEKALTNPQLVRDYVANIKDFPSLYGNINIGTDRTVSYPVKIISVKNGKPSPVTLEQLP